MCRYMVVSNESLKYIVLHVFSKSAVIPSSTGLLHHEELVKSQRVLTHLCFLNTHFKLFKHISPMNKDRMLRTLNSFMMLYTQI